MPLRIHEPVSWKERNRDEVWKAARDRVRARLGGQGVVLDYWVTDELHDEALVMSRKVTIPVTGLWVRTKGDAASDGRTQTIEVLLELNGEWRLVQSHPLHMSIDQEISYISESLGIQRAKPDPLGD